MGKVILDLLPHFFPADLFLMLQRLGIVIAMAGLIPACFVKGDSKTAQRHFGAVLINAPTFEQQRGGTLAFAFPAALKHGLKLVAADLIGVLPHSPAPSTNPFEPTNTTKNKATMDTRMSELMIDNANFTLDFKSLEH